MDDLVRRSATEWQCSPALATFLEKLHARIVELESTAKRIDDDHVTLSYFHSEAEKDEERKERNEDHLNRRLSRLDDRIVRLERA